MLMQTENTATKFAKAARNTVQLRTPAEAEAFFTQDNLTGYVYRAGGHSMEPGIGSMVTIYQCIGAGLQNVIQSVQISPSASEHMVGILLKNGACKETVDAMKDALSSHMHFAGEGNWGEAGHPWYRGNTPA